MPNPFAKITFTDGVQKAQNRYGARAANRRLENLDRPDELTASEAAFIAERDGFYIATVGEDGQPYVQFRGGPKGFLKVLDEHTLAYADFRGNLQYISVGNLSGNNKAALILMDYANRARLKILSEVEIIDVANAPDLIEKLVMPDYKAKIERAMVLHVKAYDWNCPQHITPRFTLEEIELATEPLRLRIRELEREIQRLSQCENRRLELDGQDF
jgi:uncharacterized protein